MTMTDVATNPFDDPGVYFLSSLKRYDRRITVIGSKDDPRTDALCSQLERYQCEYGCVDPYVSPNARSVVEARHAGFYRFPVVEFVCGERRRYVEGVDRGRLLWFITCPTL